MWRQQNPTTRADLARFDLRERGKQVVVRDLARALNLAGVSLLLGTDASAPGMFPGKSAHTELAELVVAGLTPYQALATGTRNPGSFLGRHVRAAVPFGTVTAGSRADLLLLNGSPQTDISKARGIVGVIVRGAWFTRAELDSMRAGR
jgi:imidazolonepropionase-like amidohydrolase